MKAAYPISSCEAFGSAELKKSIDKVKIGHL